MVTAGDISGLVARAGHTVDVERASVTEDEAGGRVRSWAAVSSDIEAWVQPASARTVEAYGRFSMKVTHSVYFAGDPGVKLDDRLKFRGRYLAVQGIENACEVNRLWRVDCMETSL